jgi:hypothetical protein
MAIIKRGILGGFHNKIGNVVGTSWKGRAVMKAMPLSVANPRTTPQVENRDRFLRMSLLTSDLLSSIVKPLNDRFAGNISGANLMMRRNRDAMRSNLFWQTNEVTISSGRMNAPVIKTATQTGNQITISWETNITDNFGSATDQVFIAVMKKNDARPHAVGFSNVTSRNVGTANINLPEGFSELATDTYIAMAFLRMDGTVVSNSSSKTI